MSSNKRIEVPGTDVIILGDFREKEKDLAEGKITSSEYQDFFAASRKHGLLGDIHPFAVGGSDSAIIIGISPWTMPSKLYAEKTGKIQKTAAGPKTQAMFDRGHAFEPAIRELFGKMSGLKVEEFPYQVTNKRWPHCVGNIDGIVWENGEAGVLEIKTTDFGTSTYKDFFELGEVPEYYYTQIQFYMAILGYKFCYIVCMKDLNPLTGMKHIRVEYDKDFAEDLMEKCEQFVINAGKGIAPSDEIVQSESLLKKNLIEICGAGNPAKPAVKLDSSLSAVFREREELLSEIEELASTIKDTKSLIGKKERLVGKLEDRIAIEIKDATKGYLKDGDDTWNVEMPERCEKLKWGSGASDYVRENYPDIFEEVAENCPVKRKLTISKAS